MMPGRYLFQIGFVIISGMGLCAYTAHASRVLPCPVGLNHFGQILKSSLEASRVIPENAFDDRDSPLARVDPHALGPPDQRFGMNFSYPSQTGEHIQGHLVFDKDKLYVFLKKNGGTWMVDRIIPLPEGARVKKMALRYVSGAVFTQSHNAIPAMAVALDDQVWLFDLDQERPMAFFSTGGERIHSIALHEEYLFVGVSNKILMYFPFPQMAESSAFPRPLLPQNKIPIPGGVPKMILNSEFEVNRSMEPPEDPVLHSETLTLEMRPLVFVISGNRIYPFGYVPEVREIVSFPSTAVSGPIVAARLDTFTMEDAQSSIPLPVPVLFTRLDKSGNSKLLSLSGYLRLQDRHRGVTQISAKTVPSQQALPHFFGVVYVPERSHLPEVIQSGATESPTSIANPIQPRMGLILADSEFQKGLVFDVDDDGRIGQVVHPDRIETIATILYPFSVE